MDLSEKSSVNRTNNFNLVRIVAAGAVLVSHAYPITRGPGTPEPLEGILGMSLGTLAVLTFFAVSGFFISQSFHNRSSVLEFIVARVLRIYPGLIVVLLLTVLGLGPMFTRTHFATYFSDHETLLYVPRNLILWRLEYNLPGVFSDNAYPRAINGSLWTLVYEVACYAMVALVGIFGLTLNRARIAAFLASYAVWYVATVPLLASNYDHLGSLRNIHLLSLPFVIGMVLFHFRQQVPLRPSILALLCAAAAISYRSPWFDAMFVLTWSYGVFYLGFLQSKPLLVYNRLGDYSYGVYIYAFPVAQIIAALDKGCTPIAMIALSLPVTLLFAVLSWHYVEKRALEQRSALLARLNAKPKITTLQRLP